MLNFCLDYGLLFSSNILLTSEIPRTIPAFLETGLAEKIAVCAHTTRDPNKKDDKRHLRMKWLRTLKFFQKIQDQNKKIKNPKRLMSFSRPIQ
jgi:hypothetical protein